MAATKSIRSNNNITKTKTQKKGGCVNNNKKNKCTFGGHYGDILYFHGGQKSSKFSYSSFNGKNFCMQNNGTVPTKGQPFSS